MYVILIYDISSESKNLNNIYKICKRYLIHIQNSVFEGDLTNPQYLKLKKELKPYLKSEKDSCILFKARNEKWLEKEFLVEEKNKVTNFL